MNPLDIAAIPTAVSRALGAGKLEQTCPVCGRWEAAHWYCSWCLRPMCSGDWYRNCDLAERRRRRPTSAPINPPSEYLTSASNWPSVWGPLPRLPKPARQPQPPQLRAMRKHAGGSATRLSEPRNRRALATTAQLALDLAPDNTRPMAAAAV